MFLKSICLLDYFTDLYAHSHQPRSTQRPKKSPPHQSVIRQSALGAHTQRTAEMSPLQVTPGQMCRNGRRRDQNKAAACAPKNTQMHNTSEKNMRERASSERTPCARQLMPVIITHALIRLVLLPASKRERERE
jgi:hypothetical protein